LQAILQYLKDHGESLGAEIAQETGVSLETVSEYLASLAAKGDVIMCHTTRYVDDEPVEGMLYRVSGYVPMASPGRKPKAASK
jgi:DeoR/GlpR family transcriptional regulator of sugar metabolism